MAEARKARRRKPLESYNRLWLGVVAVAVVSVLIGAMLLVRVADIGYTQVHRAVPAGRRAQGGQPGEDPSCCRPL